jgi:hypothetical protein
MTPKQKLINSEIRHALRTGALPIEVADEPARDAAIRNIAYRVGVEMGMSFSVTRKSDGVWSIDIA